MSATSKQVGANIAAVRKAQGVTQQAFADRLATIGTPLDNAVISRIERGVRPIKVDELVAIAVALDVGAYLLLSADEICTACGQEIYR